MPPELPELVRAFGLGQVHGGRHLPDGLMNRNWRIDTAGGSFALKMIVDVAAATARRNLTALAPLAAAGFPVHTPVSGPTGDPVVEIGDQAFCLFPWIEGEHVPGNDLTMGQVRKLGVLLGRLHLRLNGPSVGLVPSQSAPPRPKTAKDAVAEADRLLTAIAETTAPDPFDLAAVEVLRDRRSLIVAQRDSRPADADPAFPSGWTHGDFTSSNLLWQSGEVSAILDWDRLRARPFANEVARAAILHFKADNGQLDLPRVTAFVEGYRSAAPMRADALADAVRRLWWHQVTNFWVLEFHYDRDDFASDHLLVPSENLYRWWSGNREAVESAFTCSLS